MTTAVQNDERGADTAAKGFDANHQKVIKDKTNAVRSLEMTDVDNSCSGRRVAGGVSGGT